MSFRLSIGEALAAHSTRPPLLNVAYSMRLWTQMSIVQQEAGQAATLHDFQIPKESCDGSAAVIPRARASHLSTWYTDVQDSHSDRHDP